MSSLVEPRGLARQPPGQIAHARSELVHLLQLAYSGELAATRAYLGHRHALTSRAERQALGQIIRDEVHHRHCLLEMLTELDAAPVARRERKMTLVGRSIAAFCQVGGWFFPMYGAAMLEAQNIREYEHAARLAIASGCERYVERLLEMAEVEWDHERYFREQAESHWLWPLVPHWQIPPPRAAIRESFAGYAAEPEWIVEPVVVPWLVR